MTAPLPSTLILLSDLRNTPLGSKVRFLGCVAKYNVKTGCLHLQHTHPLPSDKRSSIVLAVVDIGLLGSTVKSTDTQIGEWVNVIGYVGEKAAGATKQEIGVRVQALMLWSAGALNLMEYERAVEGRKASERRLKDI